MSTPQNDVIQNGEEIVERFGGIRPMAAKLDIAVTTVQGWKKRDAIPMARRDEILAAAAAHGINLKGLVAGAPTPQSKAANQSVAQATAPAPSRIAEDPALVRASQAAASQPSRAPAPHATASQAASQAKPQPISQPRKAVSNDEFIDLKRVRRTARTTSFFTTAAILALVGGTGYVLFGGVLPKPHMTGDAGYIESRVSTLEQTQETNAGILGQLRGQVQDMTDAFGVNVNDFKDMAQGVRSGNVQPVLQRLAGLEQYFASAGAGEGLQNMIRRMEDTLSTPQGGANIAASVDELRQIVAGLQGQVGGLQGALSEVQDQNTSLSNNLEGVSGRDLGAAAMLLTLTQMRYLIDRQAPFADDLALLQSLAGNDKDLQESLNRLSPYAQSGVLSAGGLKRELQLLSNDIITAKLKGEDLSFKERAMARINNLVSLQKDGMPVAGGEERALIAKASGQLDNGDVKGAMATLQQLDGAAAQAATPWTTQAAATLTAQNIDQQLVQNLISKLRNAAGGASAPINLAPRSQMPNDMTGQTPASQPQMPQVMPQATPQVTQPQPDISRYAPQSMVGTGNDGLPEVIIVEE